MSLPLLRSPTGFSFGIDDNPSKIPPSFGISFVCTFDDVLGGGGRDGAFEFEFEFDDALLLLLQMRPDSAGPLLSTVTVFFSLAPFCMLCNNAERVSPPPDDFIGEPSFRPPIGGLKNRKKN